MKFGMSKRSLLFIFGSLYLIPLIFFIHISKWDFNNMLVTFDSDGPQPIFESIFGFAFLSFIIASLIFGIVMLGLIFSGKKI